MRTRNWCHSLYTSMEADNLESNFGEKGTGGAGEHHVEHEPAMCPCSKESKWYPGLP